MSNRSEIGIRELLLSEIDRCNKVLEKYEAVPEDISRDFGLYISIRKIYISIGNAREALVTENIVLMILAYGDLKLI